MTNPARQLALPLASLTSFSKCSAYAALALVMMHATVAAQTPPAARAAPGMGTFGSGSKEPIAIESDHLEVFDKEQKAIYSGNVVVTQGETTMKSGRMVVYYVRNSADGAGGKGAPAPAAPAAASGPDLGGGTALRKVEAFEGVTIVSKDQVATSRDAVYDKDSNRMILTGDASLTQNGNVTKGEKVVYDLTTGVAVVEAAPNSGRVKSLLVPNSSDKAEAKHAKPGQTPAPANPKPPQRP
jgi:lipopolysaccharide export system protein LptA